MGLWDKLDDAWVFPWEDDAGDEYKSAWGESRSNYQRGWGGITGAASTWWGGLTNLVSTAWNDPGDLGRAYVGFVGGANTMAAKQGGLGVAGLLGGYLAQPLGPREVFHSAIAIQDELIKRPIGALALRLGDVAGEDTPDERGLLDWGSWKDAYNITGKGVTAGQALTYGYVNAGERMGITDAGDRWDPRNPQTRQDMYLDGGKGKWTSGAADFAITVLADPVVIGGKLAVAAKAAKFSRVMDDVAIRNGAVDKYVDGARYNKAMDFVQNKARSPEHIRQTLLAGHASGDKVASIWWKVRQDKDLLDLSTRAMYADPDAFAQLAVKAPQIADALAVDVAGGQSISSAIGAANLSAADAKRVLAWHDTKRQAIVDQMRQGEGLFGQLHPTHGGLLTGQAQPRLTATSAMRTGWHNTLAFAPAVWVRGPVGMVARTARTVGLAGSARYTGVLDVNDFNSITAFRLNMERSRLPRADVEKWSSAYGAATSAESRANIAWAAEREAIKESAVAHGHTPEAANRLMSEITASQLANRNLLSRSPIYFSDEVRKAGERLRAANEEMRALEMDELGTSVQAAIDSGRMPKSALLVPDRDGNAVLIADRWQLNPEQPLMRSQTADHVPMVDFRALDQALYYHRTGPTPRAPVAGKARFRVANSYTALADAVNGVYKLSAVMRPGWTPRILSDDVARRVVQFGMSPVVMSGTRGVRHAAMNSYNRLAAVVRPRRGLGEPSLMPTPVVEEAGTAAEQLTTDLAGFGGQLQSYDRALADGWIDRSSFFDAVSQHAGNGTLPAPLAHMYQARQTGIWSQQRYEREALDWSLAQVGRGNHADPVWQRAFIDTVQAGRKAAAKRRGTPAPVVVDPFSGKAAVKVAPEDFTPVTSAVVKLSPDTLYDFVASNSDELLKPRSLLHAQTLNGGNTKLSVVKVGDHITDAVKPTGGQRFLAFGRQGREYRYRGAGLTGDYVEVQTAQGPLRFGLAFEGAEGARAMAQASARGAQDAWMSHVMTREHRRLIDKLGTPDVIDPRRPEYALNLERALNTQIGNDPVARLFLAGKSEGYVFAWLRRDPAGRSWYHALGPAQGEAAGRVLGIKALVDTYVPEDLFGTVEGVAARNKILDRSAKVDDIEALFGARDYMPAVHGQAIRETLNTGQTVTRVLGNMANGAAKVFSELPLDKASRFPLFDQRYRDHLAVLAKGRAEQFQKAGLSVRVDDVHNIRRAAQQRALLDVKKYLYDASTRLDVAHSTRFVVPFSSAIVDSIMKWGLIARERGVIGPAIQLQKAWFAPDRAGLVQDEQGNHKRWENGKYVWYRVDAEGNTVEKLPESYRPRDERIVFQLPEGIAPETLGGAKMVSSINKDALNTMLSLPSAGPVVSYPVNQYVLKVDPELENNRFVKKFVLPFGATSSDWKALVPANARNVVEMFTADTQDDMSSLVAGVMQTEYTRYSLGERDTAPTMDEIMDSAAHLRFVEGVYKLGGLSTQLKSPFQPYADAYRQLIEQSGDRNAARAEFINRYGDEFRFMTAAVTRNNLGLPATVGAYKQQKRFQDLIAQFPGLAPLIVGKQGAGSFANAVYQTQLEQPLGPGTSRTVRERMTLEESIREVEESYVWSQYQKLDDKLTADMVERGLTSLRSRGAADLKRAKDEFVAEHQYWTSPTGVREVHPWYQEYRTIDPAKFQNNLLGMYQLVDDPRIGQRDDMLGLREYLEAREVMQARMARAKVSSLDLKSAGAFGRSWDKFVFDLKERNLAFAQVHSRYLENDNLSFNPASAFEI